MIDVGIRVWLLRRSTCSEITKVRRVDESAYPASGYALLVALPCLLVLIHDIAYSDLIQAVSTHDEVRKVSE